MNDNCQFLFWGPLSGVVIGSFFTLVGIWFTNHLARKYQREEKKNEVLENFQRNINYYQSLQYEKYFLIILYELHIHLINKDSEKHSDYYKEESQRWIARIGDVRLELEKQGAELHKNYMSYKIYHSPNEDLKKFLNLCLVDPNLKFKDYKNGISPEETEKIRQENLGILQKEFEEKINPNTSKFIEQLNKSIKV